MAKQKTESVLREQDFTDYGTARVDSKHRIVLKGSTEEHYRVYRNAAGQILLDPQVMIPAHEAWLYKNKEALASVRRGLKEAGEGKLRSGPSYASHADDELGGD